MLELHKKKNSLLPSAECEKIEREIAVTDEKIDEIVYGLYGVTDKPFSVGVVFSLEEIYFYINVWNWFP